MPIPLPNDTLTDCLFDTETNDIVIVGDDVAMVGGLQGIAQEAAGRFSLWMGEWFLNPNEGLPMLQRIIQMGATTQDLGIIFSNALKLIPGLISVDSLSVVKNTTNRTLTVNWSGKTSQGLFTSADFPPFVIPYDPTGTTTQ